ncbi:UGSC family (seleno)protein [Microbacterium marinilacus]|uniref:UGSC family (Seleno)protein n=1 Tax=Microbacterium marinilacus TaxID=415209 RepID=A0ABP7BJK1_9MICO|nr:UGSC family (seleno)protein [Microbacterium marinilacus]MBY0689759.1 hypothetical protein [Microbacterium marinilacus]
MTMEALLDPTGMDERSDESTLSPRPTSLRGLSVGLLDNTKVNATQLLEEISKLLKEQYGAGAARLYTKDYFGTPVKEELLEQIVADSDIVVTAVGDCGSCSAATVADGILFERAGVPTVSIVSSAFYPSGQAMATVQGFPGFDFAAVQHPMASLSGDEVRERARQVVPEIVRILGVED